jgi:hypothetical protein
LIIEILYGIIYRRAVKGGGVGWAMRRASTTERGCLESVETLNGPIFLRAVKGEVVG